MSKSPLKWENNNNDTLLPLIKNRSSVPLAHTSRTSCDDPKTLWNSPHASRLNPLWFPQLRSPLWWTLWWHQPPIPFSCRYFPESYKSNYAKIISSSFSNRPETTRLQRLSSNGHKTSCIDPLVFATCQVRWCLFYVWQIRNRKARVGPARGPASVGIAILSFDSSYPRVPTEMKANEDSGGLLQLQFIHQRRDSEAAPM